METIRVDCPHCSMDHAITLIPGLQQHTCTNCGGRYVVIIDNYGRVNVRRENNLVDSPVNCYEIFLTQIYDNLKKDDWQLVQGHSKLIDLVAKKEHGIGWPIHFIGSVSGDKFHNFSEMRATFDEFHDFIKQNTDSFDILHSFSGLLLFNFTNVYQTNLDDECRQWKRTTPFSRLIVSAAAFDFSTESYLGSTTNHGHEWNSIIPAFLSPINLKKCRE